MFRVEASSGGCGLCCPEPHADARSEGPRHATASTAARSGWPAPRLPAAPPSTQRVASATMHNQLANRHRRASAIVILNKKDSAPRI
jgi:hypothetical protein